MKKYDEPAVSVMDSPLGPLTLVAATTGLREVHFGDHAPARAADIGGGGVASATDRRAAAIIARARQQLAEYFAGARRTFDLPLVPQGTSFQLAAWRVLRGIPYGETITYGEQAKRIGRPSAARAAGAANGRNPLAIVVPCHRVVGAGGRLVGFGGGLAAKRFLIDLEAAVVDRNGAG